MKIYKPGVWEEKRKKIAHFAVLEAKGWKGVLGVMGGETTLLCRTKRKEENGSVLSASERGEGERGRTGLGFYSTILQCGVSSWGRTAFYLQYKLGVDRMRRFVLEGGGVPDEEIRRSKSRGVRAAVVPLFGGADDVWGFSVVVED